jgi:hypothetical protein
MCSHQGSLLTLVPGTSHPPSVTGAALHDHEIFSHETNCKQVTTFHPLIMVATQDSKSGTRKINIHNINLTDEELLSAF